VSTGGDCRAGALGVAASKSIASNEIMICLAMEPKRLALISELSKGINDSATRAAPA
jgi:hypothetical protein